MLGSELCIFMSHPWNTCGDTQGLVRIAPPSSTDCNFMSQRTIALRHGAPETLNMKPERDRAVA